MTRGCQRDVSRPRWATHASARVRKSRLEPAGSGRRTTRSVSNSMSFSRTINDGPSSKSTRINDAPDVLHGVLHGALDGPRQVAAVVWNRAPSATPSAGQARIHHAVRQEQGPCPRPGAAHSRGRHGPRREFQDACAVRCRVSGQQLRHQRRVSPTASTQARSSSSPPPSRPRGSAAAARRAARRSGRTCPSACRPRAARRGRARPGSPPRRSGARSA